MICSFLYIVLMKGPVIIVIIIIGFYNIYYINIFIARAKLKENF